MGDKIGPNALNTRSYSALVEWGESYNRPSATIRNPFDAKITCYEFHEKRQVFLLGFNTGEVNFFGGFVLASCMSRLAVWGFEMN